MGQAFCLCELLTRWRGRTARSDCAAGKDRARMLAQRRCREISVANWAAELEEMMAQTRLAKTRFGLARGMVIAAAAVTAVAALLLALSPFAARAAARAQGGSAGSEADAKAIKQVFVQWYESFSRHDAHAAAMIFAEDADFTNMGGAHNHGRKEIEEHLARLFTGNLKDASRTDIVKGIRFISPQIAEVDADTVITGTKAADGSQGPPRKGLMVTTMTKQNGRWLISVFHEVEFPPAPAR